MRPLSALAAALVFVFAARGARADGCVRPTDDGGFEGYAFDDAPVHDFGNDAVRVWYATEGANAVNPASSRGDGVPDDVAAVAQVTADALASYAAMGYRPPISDAEDPACGSNGGDGRLDVYLVHMVGADGVTVVEPGRCTSAGAADRCAAFVLAQANFAELAAYYPSAADGIRTVLPHETFHVVQDAYDADLDRFWAEGTAQWAAKTLDPALDDLERFLPDFFDQPARALDAPANGVTSAFLYGAAIWPVFLTQRHGDSIVRTILEHEADGGPTALQATDAVLAEQGSSLAADYATFAVWNAATGARADDGGYARAAAYPEVPLTELIDGGTSGITSSLASFYFRVAPAWPATIAIDTDLSRNAAALVPLENGVARLDRVAPLPAPVDGEAIVVVSGITTHRSDAPFTLTISPSVVDAGAPEPDAGAPSAIDGGSSATTSTNSGCASTGLDFSLGALVVALGLRRRRALVALLVPTLLACSRAPTPVAPATKPPPARIVSVGGAVTEVVYALGAGDRVVGVDTSSLFPEAATKLPQVGYQRALSAEGVLALSPTLVLASAEAGPPAALEQLRGAGARVELVAAKPSADGARERITQIAKLLDADPAPLLQTLDADLARANALVAHARARPRVLALYARGANTLLVFGKQTSADAMLTLAGADNAVTAFEGSRPLTAESVVQAAPDVVLVPSRGLESVGGVDGLFKLPGLAQTPAAKDRRVVAMDDLLLLGFGPRTGQAALELAQKLHPELAAETR